jgi:two-component system response regulator FixJ
VSRTEIVRRAQFLVIDDDERCARSFATLLRTFGEVATAATIGEAERALRRRSWTGIVLDVRLPDGDGIALLGRIRARDRMTRVLVVTGTLDVEVANDCYRLGAGVVFKPHVADELLVFAERAILSRAEIHVRAQSALRGLSLSHKLTAREAQIAELVTLGVPRSQLAPAMGVSENTVKSTVRRLLAKFQESRLDGVARVVVAEIVRLSAREAPGL